MPPNPQSVEEEVQPMFQVRRADPDDIDTLCAVMDRSFADDAALSAFERYHGLPDESLRTPAAKQKFFLSLIETCFMSVTVEDEEGNIAGFAALDDVPIQMMNKEGAGTRWEDWLVPTYQELRVTGENSLWVACCLCEQDTHVVGEILRSTFSTMAELRHLLVFVPSTVSQEEALFFVQVFEEHFRELEAIKHHVASCSHWASSSLVPTPDGGEQEIHPEVLVCQRPDVITPLFIRTAKVEDHDNLVAVFNEQSEVVTDVYGDYFIAELIEAQNEENKALVAEVDGRAVGLMCFTSDVDVNVLAQCFQLDAYDNLVKPRTMQRIREFSDKCRSGLMGPNPSMCSKGDYMQIALSTVDVESMFDASARLDDGRITGVQLLQALQSHEFADEVGQALPDFANGMMTLYWQANYMEPMLEGASMVDPKQVNACIQTFLGLYFEERHVVVKQILAKWMQVQDLYKLALEAANPVEEGANDEEVAAKGLNPVDLRLFLRSLTSEEGSSAELPGPVFSQELLVKFIMVLHWWGDVNISTPGTTVPPDIFKKTLDNLKKAEEGLSVGHPDSPNWLANLPAHTKDVFCVNMCCLDQAYQTQALDFLMPAFALYPEKDYCIITQPHTAPNSPLLSAFTIVTPQAQNTFSHVLYLIHRAALFGAPRVRELAIKDLRTVEMLIEGLENDVMMDISNRCERFCKSLGETKKTRPEDRTEHAFVAEFDEQVVGIIMLDTPPPDVVDTLRCCYHLDDYLLVEHHEGKENKGHGRLAHWVLNPLFLKYARRLKQGAMRLCGRTVLYMETDLLQTVSPVFREFLQVAPRRPPQLKKALRKPPKTFTFANVEKEVPTEDDLKEKERQKLLRAAPETKALSIVAKKLLSESKIPVNARIVVVGASDCGLSFLESLLSIPHLIFNSLTLLAPGGLEYHHSHHLPLIAGTAAYSHQELRRIMLELRVRILDSRMVQIDRQQRCCILHDGTMLPYDYLIVGAGLQDDALHSLKLRSWGITHLTEGYRRVNGAMSVADPAIRDLLVVGGTLIKSLIWNPLSHVVVYGRSLHAYCVVQGLLLRKVPPTKIILVLPPRLKDASHQLPVDAFFDGDPVERKIHEILESMEMNVYDGYKLLSIQQDNRERLKSLHLEEHPCKTRVPPPEARSHRGALEDAGLSPDGLPSKLLACRILVTADSVNIDPDIFNSVHGNGLVYDGRLIVDHNFKTTDDGIFGAGRLCEFSRRFQRKNNERYLRHDGFNGREVGAKLAQALLRVLDPVNGDMLAAGALNAAGAGSAEGLEAGASEEELSSPELLPDFYMPIAKGGLLPGNLHYYRVNSCQKTDIHAEMSTELKPENVIMTDTLDLTNGKGHFCRLTVDTFGKVDSITYLGGEDLQVESLWSLVGLSETFLNHLYQRHADGDIPDIVEFLTDNWATALFHDRFMDFCHQIKLDMWGQEDIQNIINTALESVNLKEGLSRKLLASIHAQLPKEAVKKLQDHLLEYLRGNTNHLKTYYLPENWSEKR